MKGKAVSLRYTNSTDSTFTVILANFNNIGYNTNITLGQVFWIENDKPQKLLIISSSPLTIKEYFTDIEDARGLRKKLKAHSFIELFDDNFSQYSQRFRHLFGMNSDKAIDLFYQTVSMKSVSSLTAFVREQMLERTEIKTQIDELKKRFDDLNKAYAAVQEARRQRDILKPLVELGESFGNFERLIQEIDNIVQSIPSWFASKKVDLLQEEIKLCEGKLNQLATQLSLIKEGLKIKRKAENQISQDIDNNGGARLKQIAYEIEQRGKDKKSKKGKYELYSELTSVCGLPTANAEKTFYSNLKSAKQKIGELENRQQIILGEHGKLIGKISLIDENIESENKELESLKNRVNQIPLEILNIREQLANDLEIKEEEIPFAGELLKVNESEKDWEGALERLLRGFGISMLVPEKHYRQISEYVNARKLKDNKNRGMRFEYFKASHNFKLNNFQNDIDTDSVVNKIDIKTDTPFEEWLQAELQRRFNLRCVPLEEFQRQSDVITKEGQFKTGSQRHTKDDRRELWDRRNFVLGWTNKEKILAVEKHLNELRKEKKEIDEALGKLKTEIGKNTTLNTKLNLVTAYTNWNELNWQDEAKEISKLEMEKKNLESSNDILKTLQEQLKIVQNEIGELEKQQTQGLEDKGKFDEKTKENREEIEECKQIAATLLQNERESFYPKIAEELKDTSLTVKNIDKAEDNFLKLKNEERKSVTEKQSSVRDKIIKQMKEYKNQFPSDSMELSDEIESRAEYLDKLNKILKDGLPTHEARFKKMLNENTINDIVAFDSKLDNHFKSIKKKIEEINKHLKEIEFNKGTYIKLLDDRNSDQEIKQFRQELKECYSNILGTSDAYTEDRFTQVKNILDRFSSNDSKQIEWTNKVTDVRNWFIFNASEKYLEDDSEKEFYAGTSGKSGGQKEKLAYTILASALAYQFGLSYGEPRSKSFRFVVIDEAFGRGDDESTQFGLGLFKKLNLQLLIVTPLQKIHVIENYINSVHYVSNTDGNNSQLQNLTVEEYKEQKYLHNALINRIEITETN
ncbi:MAG: hypothetical protein HZB80_00980 [Deltaproteobacteria bacterium]|nr:hypothetical protein [Deltaproteobacteria bacterium]